MTKIELDNIEVLEYDADVVIQCNIEPILLQLAIAITLLNQDYINNIEIWKSKPKLHIDIVKNIDNYPICKIITQDSLRILLFLDIDTLEYIQGYLLRYIRDGVADVRNFDIYVPIFETKNGELTLTLQASSSIPPIDPDEARRRING